MELTKIPPSTKYRIYQKGKDGWFYPQYKRGWSGWLFHRWVNFTERKNDAYGDLFFSDVSFQKNDDAKLFISKEIEKETVTIYKESVWK